MGLGGEEERGREREGGRGEVGVVGVVYRCWGVVGGDW